MAIGTPEQYWLVRFLFQRGLALIYLIAFLVAATQFRPLVGEHGLLPIPQYLQRVSVRERPSIFHYVPTDRALGISAWTGVILSGLAVIGVPYFFPEPYPLIISIGLWFVLWILYLSFVNVGQIFYGYGWESMLLETGFLAIFLGAGATNPPVVLIWLLKWVLFRNMFGAGLIKIRGDDCWRDLTCMTYHYETQPMPNPLSWWAHHLPDRFHKAEVLGNHIVELAIPFLYFAPQPFATIAGLITIGFQLWLMVTGNFSWLNALTIVLGTATFTDPILTRFTSIGTPIQTTTSLYLEAIGIGIAVMIVLLSIRPLLNMVSETQIMNTSFDPLHLVNTYGAFGTITRRRYQLVIEGTTADNPTESDWKPYEFKGQPVDLHDRPPQWAPYHLRLDWQLWFAAMRPRPGPREQWFPTFFEKLGNNDPGVCSLIKSNPFKETSPTHVRAVRYEYAFTDPAERRETDRYWNRTRLGIYYGPITPTQH